MTATTKVTRAGKIRIFVVTSDSVFLQGLQVALAYNGFLVCGEASTTDEALSRFVATLPHLTIIDLALAAVDAPLLCERLYLLHPATRIVLATNDQLDVPLESVQHGVAGWVGRDFPPYEWPGLLAFVAAGGAILNQAAVAALMDSREKPAPRTGVVTVGALEVDLVRHYARLRGRKLDLTPREFALLACLARHLDHVISIDRLLTEAWGLDGDSGEPSQVRLYITRLRRKLTDQGRLPDPIVTERGMGYRLTHEAITGHTDGRNGDPNAHRSARIHFWA